MKKDSLQKQNFFRPSPTYSVASFTLLKYLYSSKGITTVTAKIYLCVSRSMLIKLKKIIITFMIVPKPLTNPPKEKIDEYVKKY